MHHHSITTSLFFIICTILYCSIASVSLAQQDGHICASSNVTLLHWNVTDPSFPTSPYPIYFPQLPDLQFLVDVDGAAQPVASNDANVNDTLKGTTFSMMFHVVKNKEDKAFYKTVYLMNSKQPGQVKKLMDCNIQVTQGGIPYCDSLLLLPNSVSTNGKNSLFLWNVIGGRQYGSGPLNSSIIPFFYTHDITSYTSPSFSDAAELFPLIISDVAT